MNMPQVFEVESFWSPGVKSRHRRQYVFVWCWDWNGGKMVKTYYWLSIERFLGTKDIDQLSCFPIQYYETGEELFK